MYCVTRKMNPNSAKNATVTAPLAAEKAGVRNNDTSIIGCRRRRSIATKLATRIATATKPQIVSGSLHPLRGASMIV